MECPDTGGLTMATRADRGNDGARALYDAAMDWDDAGVLALLESGVDPNAADSHGRTALHAVCFDADPDSGELSAEGSGLCADVRIIDALVRHGADVNARDSTGQTPLFDALRGDGPNLRAARALIDRGALVDAVDHAGRSPLMESISWWNGKSVLFLLRAGARLRARDRDGVTVEELVRAHAPEHGQDAGIRAMILGDAEAVGGSDPRAHAPVPSAKEAAMSGREWTCASLALAMQAGGAGLLFSWGMPLSAGLWMMMIPVNVWLLIALRRVIDGPVVPVRIWTAAWHLLRSALVLAVLMGLHRMGWGWAVWVIATAYVVWAMTMLRWLRNARAKAIGSAGGTS